MKDYSFILPLSNEENPNFLKDSIDSMLSQSLSPKEIIIIIDNIINPDHLDIIKSYKENKFKIINYIGKGGLGDMLAKGVLSTSTEIILRQDSDDISMKDRAKLQISHLINTKADILGSDIREFYDTPGDLKKSLKKTNMKNNYYYIRNPLNHMSVAFQKNSIIQIGNYLPLKNFEDWYLWLRAIKFNFKIETINEPLVYARVGKNFYNKRHGYKYFCSELIAMKTFFREKLIPARFFFLNIFIRFFIRLFPLRLTNFFYKRIREE